MQPEQAVAKLLFRLNGVDDDEADEVREVLQDFDTYETQAGRWGLSVAAIWLRHDDDLDAARQTLDAYQQARSERLRAEFSQQPVPDFWQRLRQRPADHIAVALAVLLIITLLLWPFSGWH